MAVKVSEELAVRLRQALEMHAEGVAMMRLNLRRRHPDTSAEGIDWLLGEWLCDRPGAPFGDAVGRPRPSLGE